MRKCPRTLDKPLLLLGLELEDLGLLALVGGGGGVLFGPVIPAVLAIAGWILLIQLKKDKPPGFLLHLLYKQGMQLPGLLPPFKKFKYYGIYGTKRFPQLKICRTMGPSRAVQS